ncbi:transcriptional regulator GcvA [Pseudomonas monteilii]|uniref:HTH-type transcriptional regulator TrpI n=1 Tax=Pseudomonas monteilii TaxID=76759 RepID=A0A399M704_9PSED|nr:transcriptional regulator GcvA [Pseudomonas monteilii]RII77548.1 transcriptional regulator GcvA [Pseudomonas monteilii]
MKDKLPPLNAVRAFEAVARHLSITLAADELNVTPGAVSRQIRTLEEFMEQPLFTRGHRQVSLTPAGEQYFNAVARLIEELRTATRHLKRPTKRRQIKVRAYTTFAMQWLIPRLASFHLENPKIEVLLTASLDPVDFQKEDLDAAIRLGAGDWPNCISYVLSDNLLAPVCSPALLATEPGLRSPADIAEYTMLHSIARPDDWAYWLEATGVIGQVDATAGMIYQSSSMVYAAAIGGQGIAMAQLFLVGKELREGTLVRPFEQTVDRGAYTYYLLTPKHRPEREDVSIFRQWILEQARLTRVAE